MDRRSFLTLLAATLPLARVVAAAPRQDLEFLRAVDRAQENRPHVLGASARIAPATEPGSALVIHGRLFQRGGQTPAPGIVVFAYHTDATGRYDVPEAGPHSWRLRGWAKTDADGQFEFTTIRPAPYPSGRVAAHVHAMICDLSRRGMMPPASYAIVHRGATLTPSDAALLCSWTNGLTAEAKR